MRWGGLTVRPAAPEDADDLAPRLRTSDIEELRVTSGQSPHEALSRSIELSDAPFTFIDAYGQPHAITGAAGLDDGSGCIWLLGSDWLEQNPRAFAALTRDTYRCVSERYTHVWNLVDARRADTRRWLRWLGFVEMWSQPAPLDPSVEVVGVIYVQSRRSCRRFSGLLRDAAPRPAGREATSA